MSMRNLIILLLLCVVGWLVWTKLKAPEKTVAPPVGQDSLAAQTPAPVAQPEENQIPLPVLPVVKSSELVVLRGRVKGTDGEVIIVECGPDPEPPPLAFSSAYVGGGDTQALAKWAISIQEKEILKEFGPLKTVSNGVLQASSMTPEQRPIGRFAIYGYPKGVSRVHVVAAPVGKDFNGLPLYAVSFKLGTAVSSSVSTLAYPPDVNTPEERRAYLQAMAEARKKRAQQSVGQSGN